MQYLEVWQEAVFSLVTSVSPGREAAHRRHSNCQGDGNLSEFHTPCHWSDICRFRWKCFSLESCTNSSQISLGHAVGCLRNKTELKTSVTTLSPCNQHHNNEKVRQSCTCPLTTCCPPHKTPLRCNIPQRSDPHQSPLPCGWWGDGCLLSGTWGTKGFLCSLCFYNGHALSCRPKPFRGQQSQRQPFKIFTT